MSDSNAHTVESGGSIEKAEKKDKCGLTAWDSVVLRVSSNSPVSPIRGFNDNGLFFLPQLIYCALTVSFIIASKTEVIQLKRR